MKKLLLFCLFFFVLLAFNVSALHYGEMWNYTANVTAWVFPMAGAGIYYNMTGLFADKLDGFNITYQTQANGGSYLTSELTGRYKVDAAISVESIGNKQLYAFSIAKNFRQSESRNCYARRYISIQAVVASTTITCILDLIEGDTINLQIENEAGVSNLKIHAINVNAIEIPSNSNWFFAIILALLGTAFVFIFIYKSFDSIHTPIKLLFLLTGIILLVICANLLFQFVSATSGYISSSSVISALTNITSKFYKVLVTMLYFTIAYFVIMFLMEVFTFLANIRKR